MESVNWPKISVVIPIKNEAEFIASTLNQILSQDYPPDKMEILVVAADSEDGSREIVAEMVAREPRVKMIRNPFGLSSGGRNIGIRSASGGIITFIDGHTYIKGNQLLRATAQLMAEKELAVLSRPQFLEPPDNNLFQRAVAIARRSIIGHGLDSTIYTDKDAFVEPTSSGASYRREVFDRIGHYDERFDACEDVELNYRAFLAGYKSFTSMRLAVFYYPRKTLTGLFKQMKRYGIGRFRLWRKHRGPLSSGALIPAMFLAGLLITAIISFFIHPFLYLLLGAVGLYLAVILSWSIFLSLKKDFRYILFLPFIYPAIHFGLGYGFAREAILTILGKGINFKADK
jgi:cellulose synthase/poly-beta-1,6-N-acetylglucosamine synthase-like glycosyltransferase